MRSKCTHHLNWIKFTVEFGKKHAEMPLISNRLLKEGDLVAEVFFLAEEVSHAAVFVFDWANGGTFCPHPRNVEAMFFKRLLQSFWLTGFKSHLLGKPTKTWFRIAHRNCCILLFSLFSAI